MSERRYERPYNYGKCRPILAPWEREWFMQLASHLPISERNKGVLEAWLDPRRTYGSINRRYGISRSRVAQIAHTAFRRVVWFSNIRFWDPLRGDDE